MPDSVDKYLPVPDCTFQKSLDPHSEGFYSADIGISTNTPFNLSSTCVVLALVAGRQDSQLQPHSRARQNAFPTVLQYGRTAGLCHCNHTYVDLLVIQVCSEQIEMQHWSGQNALSNVQNCSAKQAHSRLVSLQLHL